VSAFKAFVASLAAVLALLVSVLTAGTAVAAPAVPQSAPIVQASLVPAAFVTDDDDDEDWDEDSDDSHESKPAPKTEVSKPAVKVSPKAVAQPSGSSAGTRALAFAKTRFGDDYSWGGSTPGAFDCSGLTSWAFKKAGVTLPRSSRAQSGVGRAVSFNELQPGDLVFYYNPVGHVGIYAGGGKMVDSADYGQQVGYRTVSKSAFSGARRL